MDGRPLGRSQPYPPADPSQVFQDNSAVGALRLGYNPFADYVIRVSDEPSSFRDRLRSSRLALCVPLA
jgi:hypothetical protein